MGEWGEGGGVLEHIGQMCKVEEVLRSSTKALPVCRVIADQHDVPPNWIDEIISYITTSTLSKAKSQIAKVKKRESSFELLDDQLYKRSFGGPLLKFLLPPQVE